MAEAGKSPIRGVLDGDIGPSDLTASDRGQQAQSDIDVAIAAERAQTVAALASSSAPSAVQPGQITTAAPGSGSGYHFDAETIAQRIKDWKQVLDDIKTDQLGLEAAWQSANPPSPDRPAFDNVQATRTSIQAAIQQNRAMQQYAQEWIAALQKANGTYVETDHDTSKGLPNTGSATDGSALNQ